MLLNSGLYVQKTINKLYSIFDPDSEARIKKNIYYYGTYKKLLHDIINKMNKFKMLFEKNVKFQ